MTEKQIKVGDMVLLEQCWEDSSGHYHDEWVEVARFLPDGSFKVRIGHWKTRKAKEEQLQAWLNKFDWYPKDVSDVDTNPL